MNKSEIKDEQFPMFELNNDEIRRLKWVLWKYRLGLAHYYLCFNLCKRTPVDCGLRRRINDTLSENWSVTLDHYLDKNFQWGAGSKGRKLRKRWIELLLECNKRG